MLYYIALRCSQTFSFRIIITVYGVLKFEIPVHFCLALKCQIYLLAVCNTHQYLEIVGIKMIEEV